MLYSEKPITPLKLTFDDINLPVYTFNTVIVGSGAAGLNAADSLFNMGQKDIAILTDGMKKGVSKNSGDNRQTYYRAAMASESDSRGAVYDMAKELCRYGSMDGDIALTEAALSLRCFHRLADIGADFPQNVYGEFLDYADCSRSDPAQHEGKSIKRVIDAGMFTAKKIAERLENQMLGKDIPIFNRFRVVSIIKDTDDNGNDFIVGLLAIDRDMQHDYKEKFDRYIRSSRLVEANKNIFEKIQQRISGTGKSIGTRSDEIAKKENKPSVNKDKDKNENFYIDEYIEEPIGNKYGYTLFRAVNIIYAAGAPGGIYGDRESLYPSDSMSSFSPAFAIGVLGKNLTETKFGIASVVGNQSGKSGGDFFKWKISGVFQRAVPRYFSTDSEGNDEKDFLDDYFESKAVMLEAVLNKAADWHFDVRKLYAGGSSIIDLAVYVEKLKGRKVYLDYFYNPGCLTPEEDGGAIDEAILAKMSRDNIAYRPYERLIKLDFDSYKLFYDNGIDLKRSPVEIEICAEHLNGGLARDIYSESNVTHFFAVGEAAATFGVYAPSGSSLNSTQVTSLRAAQKIARDYSNTVPVSLTDFWATAHDEVNKYVVTARQLLKNAVKNVMSENIFDMREKYRARFSECAMIARPLNDILMAITGCVMDMAHFLNDNAIDDVTYLPDVFINHDILITQYTFLHALKNYIISGGRSRGSYIILENKEDVLEIIENIKNAEKFKSDKSFEDILCKKIKYKQRKRPISSIVGKDKELEDYIEETDYNRLISCVRIKSFLTYEPEFFTEEIREIPYDNTRL